ncbi:MAG: acyl-CoA reductase [Bacteroidota bacterium]
MTIDNRIKAFVKLGSFLEQFAIANEKQAVNTLNDKFYTIFNDLIQSVHYHNGWFTEDNVRNAISSIASSLDQDKLTDWLNTYTQPLSDTKTVKNIAVIMAGNIPMVGFHDMLCILLSGNKFTGKLSSDDKLLLTGIAKVLITIEPEFANYIEFTEGQLKNIDAVIATGSNNSARYFEYYFGKYPHIIRKNRNSAAILTGNESNEDLKLLGKDIFQYFGLGCRNVSKLFVPAGYKFDPFYEAIFGFQYVVNNNKYGNNYEYNRTVYLMSSQKSLLDNNFLLLKEDSGYSSPIGVLFYEYYEDLDLLNLKLENEKEQIQCIVSKAPEINNSIAFGEAQSPNLNDYADGVDTMAFLVGL